MAGIVIPLVRNHTFGAVDAIHRNGLCAQGGGKKSVSRKDGFMHSAVKLISLLSPCYSLAGNAGFLKAGLGVSLGIRMRGCWEVSFLTDYVWTSLTGCVSCHSGECQLQLLVNVPRVRVPS